MNPDSRFSASLVLGLLVSVPVLRQAAGGDVAMTTAGVRFVVAFLVFFFVVGWLGRLYNKYLATHLAAAQVMEEIEAAEAGAESGGFGGEPDGDGEIPPRRRASDV